MGKESLHFCLSLALNPRRSCLIALLEYDHQTGGDWREEITITVKVIAVFDTDHVVTVLL